jgi:hypothetical protein
LQSLLQSLAGRLTLFALCVSGLGALVGALREWEGGRGAGAWQRVLLTALSLAFATIPEELPLLVAAVLAVGAQALAEKGIYVKSLKAQEALAYVDVILTDKTGTLTENRLSLSAIALPSGGEGEEEVAEEEEGVEEGLGEGGRGGREGGRAGGRRDVPLDEGELRMLLETWAFTSSTSSLAPGGNYKQGIGDRKGEEGKEGGEGGEEGESTGRGEGNRMPPQGEATKVEAPSLAPVQGLPDVFDRAVLLSYLLQDGAGGLTVQVRGRREGGRGKGLESMA